MAAKGAEGMAAAGKASAAFLVVAALSGGVLGLALLGGFGMATQGIVEGPSAAPSA